MVENDAYTLRFDTVSGIWHICLQGMWAADDARRYAAALREIVDTAPASRRIQLLVDMQKMPVQPRPVLEAIQAALSVFAALRREDRFRVALVQPASMLSMLQARRAAADETSTSSAAFTEVAAAEAWLRAG